MEKVARQEAADKAGEITEADILAQFDRTESRAHTEIMADENVSFHAKLTQVYQAYNVMAE